MLRAYQLSMNGKESAFQFKDLSASEITTFAIIAGVVVLLGVYPQILFDLVKPSLESILAIIKESSI
jgi:NADH:ubiquinone oxidoreductase subunit 4 (subunit M)